MTRTPLPLALLLAPLVGVGLGVSACAKRSGPPSESPGSYAASSSSMEGGAIAGVSDADATIAEDAASDEESGAIAARRSSAAIAAPRLTAGVFDDARNPGLLHQFAERLRQSSGAGDLPAELMEPFSIVTVVDEDGRPVAGARVQGMPTGTDGRVVLASRLLGSVRDGAQVTVEHAGQRTTANLAPGDSQATIRVTGASAAPRALDLALVIDATGSMGDELEYLKSEIGGIVEEVASAFPNLDQRWALVVYRDQGDTYVTRHYDFVTNLAAFQRHLSRAAAGGGGDYPEAMDRALEDAANLSWRDGPTARVLFLVADAPPHAEAIRRTMSAVAELQGEGVGIYPIAASGVAEEAELVMRAAALTTGGQYLFLTDDSGIGKSHEEPHIPCYGVETLRDAMTRMITSEIVGHRVEVEASRLIRSVGRGDAGVCQRPRSCGRDQE